ESREGPPAAHLPRRVEGRAELARRDEACRVPRARLGVRPDAVATRGRPLPPLLHALSGEAVRGAQRSPAPRLTGLLGRSALDRLVERALTALEQRDPFADGVALEVVGLPVGVVGLLVHVLLVEEEHAWVLRVARRPVGQAAGLRPRRLDQLADRRQHALLL